MKKKELLPHQIEAIKLLDNGKVLYGGTGVGKSITACGYYMQRELGRDIYVITTAKKRNDLDWRDEFWNFGITPDRDTSVSGILHVDSWNQIEKYTDVKDAFFIFDEQRAVGTGKWSKQFIKIAKQNRWIMLTATPGDNWMDYIPLFVANGWYKNATEFKREHVIYNHHAKYPKVDRYLGLGRLMKQRYHLLVEMPYERHTVRKTHYVTVEHDVELLEFAKENQWNPFENEPMETIADLFRVSRKVVNTSPSRLSYVRDLLSEQSRLIVFYNFDYELEILRELNDHVPMTVGPTSTRPSTSHPSDHPSQSLAKKSTSSSKGISSIGSGTSSRNSSTDPTAHAEEPSASRAPESSVGFSFAVAEWNGHKHQPIPDTDSWVYLVQYMAGSEGWNCISTDTVVFYSLTYSYKNWHQAFGRIDRLNTPFQVLNYHVLKSNSWIDQSILKSLRDKRSFNESGMKVSGWVDKGEKSKNVTKVTDGA